MSEKWQRLELYSICFTTRTHFTMEKRKSFFSLPRSGAASVSIFYHQRFTFIFNFDALRLVPRQLETVGTNALVRSCGVDTLRGIGAAEIRRFALINIDTLIVLIESETWETFTFIASDCVDTLLLTTVFFVWFR